MKAINGLIYERLLRHARDLTQGGTNASELQIDLRRASDMLQPDQLAVRIVRWARENDIHCTLGQLKTLADAVTDEPCECGCGKIGQGGMMEAIHPEDFRDERG